jgi:hypothetical protein
MKFHFILPWAMLSFLVLVVQPVIKPQTQSKVNFVGGAIDEDERVAIQVMRADYNLSLLFLIEGTEEYLDDLKVASRMQTASATRMLCPADLCYFRSSSLAVTSRTRIVTGR